MDTVVVSTPVGVETVEKEADIKTRIRAVKEILKRYPGNDKLVDQQIRKLTAEADMAEKKVELLNGGSGEITINVKPFEEDM